MHESEFHGIADSWKEMEERDANMKAESFVCRHVTAYFALGFGLIFAFLAIFGYFLLNGNAGSHIEFLRLAFTFAFTGIALVSFTSLKISGWGTLQAVIATAAWFAFIGGAYLFSIYLGSWISGL